MKVTLERIRFPGHVHFEEAMALCQEAFPPAERRDRDALLKILDEPLLNFCAAMEGERVVGLAVYWCFSRFVFVEQLAVLPGERRSGRGSGILKAIQAHGFPLLLEVEIPHDDASRGRIDFYTRNGFIPLPVRYVQPPYRQGDQVPPMRLFSDRNDWSPPILDECIREFHSAVYIHHS